MEPIRLIILALFNLKCVTGITTRCISPEPVAFWPLDGTHRTDDVSGYGHHATGYGVTVTSGFNNKQNAAYEFAGTTSSYMKIKNTPMLDVGKAGPFSYAALVYPVSNTGSFIEWTNDPYGPYIWNYPGKCILAFFNDRTSGSYASNLQVKPPIVLNQWMFLGVVYDDTAGTIKIRINDKTTTHSVSKVKAKTTGPDVYFGIRPSGAYAAQSLYKGKMSCVILWNRTLTENEMGRVRDFCEDKTRIESASAAFTSYFPFHLKVSDNTIISGNVVGTVTDVSLQECAKSCIHHSDTCITIAYFASKKECKLSETKFKSTVTDKPLIGSKIYQLERNC